MGGSSAVWIDHVVFIHQLMDIHFLGMNHAALNIAHRFLCGRMILVFLGMYPGVELLGLVVTLCLRDCQTVFEVAAS